jgi:hypothetical protein
MKIKALTKEKKYFFENVFYNIVFCINLQIHGPVDGPQDGGVVLAAVLVAPLDRHGLPVRPVDVVFEHRQREDVLKQESKFDFVPNT